MKKILKFIRNTKGQSLVEFALVLPILIALILGMVEFGWILNGQITLTSAAREGARAAVVQQSEANAVSAAQSAVTNSATNSSLTIKTISIGELNQSWSETTEFKRGNTVVVTVFANIKPITGFFNAILKLDSNGNVPLRGTAQMRIE